MAELLVKSVIFVCAWSVLCLSLMTAQEFTSFRNLFTRNSKKKLSSVASKFYPNTTIDLCSRYCVRETTFVCKSFDFDNNGRTCVLYRVNLEDIDVHLLDAQDRDHYETAFTKVFNRLPKHRLPVDVRIQIDTTVEGCAHRCIMETSFKCEGFNYQPQLRRCMMLELLPSSMTGAVLDPNIDYYQKNRTGYISSFINYGMWRLPNLNHQRIHESSQRGMSLEECARRCLIETKFDCQSFDYVHEDRQSECHLSKYLAANVHGLVIDERNPHHNHYEKIEKELVYFYATPYAVIPGNNEKTYHQVRPRYCAERCMQEEAFICRSFDYSILKGTCILSTKTGSDVGGLVVEQGFSSGSHHFEMKPLLDCGGTLTTAEGNFASPNWPQKYSHHEHCSWNIVTSPHKVISLKFTHFELKLKSSDPCNPTDDRLMITEGGRQPFCVLPNTKLLPTRHNNITVDFFTDGSLDAQGFRVFYKAEWTCDAHLSHAPGELASPNWPDSYPSGDRCSWRVSAPPDYHVQLFFDAFDLEQHTLGHCNERLDHVRILDGGTVKSPLIGLKCGKLSSFVVKSSGSEMFIQFKSDDDLNPSPRGFHARFVFVSPNGTRFDTGGLVGPMYTDLLQGEKQGSGYIVDDILLEEPGEVGAVGAGGEEETSHHKNHHSMWGVMSLLVLLLTAALVGLFLMWRQYNLCQKNTDTLHMSKQHSPKIQSPLNVLTRRRLKDHMEVIHMDGRVILHSETVPLQRPRSPPPQPPTISDPLYKPNNEMPLTTPCCIVDDDDEDFHQGAAAAPPLDHTMFNNLDLGKYAKDNAKNINVEKCENI